MTRKLWVLLSIAWALTMAGAFATGRSYAKGWNKDAQVECLVKMRGGRLTLKMYREIQTLKKDP